MSITKIIQSKLGKNIVLQYGLQIAKYIFPLITVPYLTRVLQPEAYAIRAYVLAAMSFFQVFLDYGFTPFGTKAIATTLDSPSERNSITSGIVLLRTILMFSAIPVLLLLCFYIPILNGNILFVLISYVTVCMKTALPDFIFIGEQDMAIITRRFVASQFAGTSLMLIVVRGPQHLILVPIIEASASLLALIWSWYDVLNSRGYQFVTPNITILKSIFLESTILFISSASTTVFNSLTTLMLGIYITDTTLISYWSISMTAITAVQSLYTPITNSLYPHMVVKRDYRLAFKLIFIGMPVVIAGTLTFALLRDVVMTIIGGTEYLPGAYVIGLVSPVLVFSYPAMIFGYPILAAIGHERQLTESSVISATFHIIGLFVLVILNCFTINNVAILRNCTEFVLMFVRVYFVWYYFTNDKSLQESRKFMR